MSKLSVQVIHSGMIDNDVYIVINEDTGECVVIDPSFEGKKVVDYIRKNGLKLQCVLLTHGHFDHVQTLGCLVDEFNVKAFANEKERLVLKNPDACFNMHSAQSITDFSPLKDGDELNFLGVTWKAIWTPGHTPGSCCYYIEEEKILFSGDTLFAGTYGRTDFEGGSEADIKVSIIEKLFKLDDDVLVLPGHGESTDIGTEKKINQIYEL